MSFGRNPHVAKAEAAEQKAQEARDASAYALAWREAARQWDRAAAREKADKRRLEYSARAEAARANADEPSAFGADERSDHAGDHDHEAIAASQVETPDKKLLN